MAIINTETRLVQLLADYVSSRREDLGLPTAEVLPFVVEPTTGDIVAPRVAFVASAFTSPHPRRIVLQVSAELQTAATEQDLGLEAVWTAGLRYALADTVAFNAWLAALSAEDRTGYRARKMRVTDGGMGVDSEKCLRGRRTDLILHVRSDEMAPPQVPDEGP